MTEKKSIGLEQTVQKTGTSGLGMYTFHQGQSLSRYRIVQPLGRGGMGEVYEVQQGDAGQHFALKVLFSEFMRGHDALERFTKEASVMAGLEHENIIRLIDATQIDGRFCLKMELANGLELDGRRIPSLKDYAEYKGGRIKQKSLAGIMTHVLRGMRYAHSQGLIHRDLKPANILFITDEHGESTFKIADFGLVGVFGDEWLRTQAERSQRLSASIGEQRTDPASDPNFNAAIAGTYEYMSPEQKQGKPLDSKSDIYSLGVMAYRLLTGRQSTEFELPSTAVPGLHQLWDQVIKKCMNESHFGRYRDCDAVLRDIEIIEKELYHESENSTKGSVKTEKHETEQNHGTDVHDSLSKLKEELATERERAQSERNKRLIAEKKLKNEVKRRKAAERRWRKELKSSGKAENQSAPMRKAPIQSKNNKNKLPRGLDI